MPSNTSINPEPQNPEASEPRGSSSGDFVAQLLIFRDHNNLSNMELSKLAGVSRVTMGRWFSGAHTPHASTAKKVCKNLGLNHRAFLTGDYVFVKPKQLEFLNTKLKTALKLGDEESVYQLGTYLLLESYHFMRTHLLHPADSVEPIISSDDFRELKLRYRPSNSIVASEVTIHFIFGPRETGGINFQISASKTAAGASSDARIIETLIPLTDALLENIFNVIQMCCKRIGSPS